MRFKEIKQLVQAANGGLSPNSLEEAASGEADLGPAEWDNGHLDGRKREQIRCSRRRSLGTVEERGVHEVVERGNGTDTRGCFSVSKMGRHPSMDTASPSA